MITLIETVTNVGPGTATNAVLYDTLPTSLVNANITTTSGTTSIDNNNVLTALLGSIAPEPR